MSRSQTLSQAPPRRTGTRGVWSWGYTLLLLGCGSEPTDRDHYVASLTEPPAAALQSCAAIDDADLRGECTTAAAGRAAQAGGDRQTAFAACKTLDGQPWSGECWFWVIDTLGLVGDQAVSGCMNAAQWKDDCLGHALSREMRAVERRHESVGEESVLTAEIVALIGRYEPEAPDPQKRAAARTMLARIIAARWEDGPIDRGLCGAADADVCALGVQVRLDLDARRADLASVCDGPVTQADVVAGGGRPWTPDSEALAVEGWTAWCEAPPDQARATPGPRRDRSKPQSMLEQFFGGTSGKGPRSARRQLPSTPD